MRKSFIHKCYTYYGIMRFNQNNERSMSQFNYISLSSMIKNGFE